MRIARYIAHGSEHYGVVDGDNVTAIDGSIFDDEIKLTDHVHAAVRRQAAGPGDAREDPGHGPQLHQPRRRPAGPRVPDDLPQDTHQRDRPRRSHHPSQGDPAL